VLAGREGGQGIGTGDQGLHRPRAVGGSEAIIFDCDRLSPLDSARDYRLAIVGVGIEVANEAIDGEAVQPASDVGLVVLPADLTVVDDVDTGLHLLLDHLHGHLILYLPQLVLAYLSPLEASDGSPQPGRPGSIGYLGIAADDGSEHGLILLLADPRERRTRAEGYDPRLSSLAATLLPNSILAFDREGVNGACWRSSLLTNPRAC